jgi:hypothetical protein
VLFLNASGQVRLFQKIDNLSGGFAGNLAPVDLFGMAVAGLSDLNGDGVPDLAVGAPGDDDGGTIGNGAGAVYILFLTSAGQVRFFQKISNTSGGFAGNLGSLDLFGIAVTGLSDLNGDGVPDLAVGAPFLGTGGAADDDRGATYILFLDPLGRVRFFQKIGQASGGFIGDLVGAAFGSAVAALDDLDGDGVPDLAVGAPFDDDGGANNGALYVLFLDSNEPEVVLENYPADIRARDALRRPLFEFKSLHD